jgi:hypothetical protein
MRLDIIYEKKPTKILKLYEIDPEDLNIQVDEVCLWSKDNFHLYELLLENGFADFICNKESIRENYKELVFN